MFERLTVQKATLPQDDGLAKVGRTYTNESGEQRFASQAFVGNKSNDLASQMGQDKKQPYDYNELLCQHKKIHRFKVYKLYSLFVFQFIALEGFIHFIRYTVI